MDSFKQRQEAFENKYKHDEELRFRVIARRNRLTGLWAAELLGLTGDAAEAYAKEVVKADFEEPGHRDVVRKILRDFEAKKVDVSEHRIEKKLLETFETAKQQLMTE